MRIVSTDTPDTDLLSGFYNQQVAPIPYCLPVTPEEFTAGQILPPQKRLSNERFFIAQEKDALLGFAHVGIHTTSRNGEKEKKGVVRFFCYLPAQRPIGQALLEAYENYLMPHGITQLTAFQGGYGYSFYNAGRENLADRFTHVLSLLGTNEYTHSHRMLLMDRRNLTPAEPHTPDASGEVSVKQQNGKGLRPNLMVELFIEGRQVGVCQSESLGQYLRASAAQDIYYVGGLGIDPQFQFQGWGKYLLHRTHWEMAQLGYKHAIIGTEQDNYRALLFYLNDGYRVLFTDYGFKKTVQSE